MKDLGAVILAGGKSSRMGKDKALLRLDNETFLQRVQKQLTAFDEVLLSVSRETQYPQSGMAEIVDQYAEIGPMGGLYSALTACSSARLLAVTCDMPFFTGDLAEYMCGYVADGYDAFVVVTREDRLQPLCAIYCKSASPILKKQIDKKNYRIIDALAFLRVKRIPLVHSVYADETVQNINTPGEYADLRRRRQGPPIIAVCGLKNTGKTTLLTGIIPCLRRAGLKVAVVKHDGHDFVPDVPGTDSYRYREAGAYAAAVYSRNRYMLTAEQSGLSTEDMTSRLPDADVILVEGDKHSDYPKIEVVRREIADQPVCNPRNLLAFCSDFVLSRPGVPTLSLADYEGVAQVLLSYIQSVNDTAAE